MIYNKSSHPVEVKKISVRLWSLRDEIEAALSRRMKECEAAGVPLYIDDIKKIYNIALETPSNVVPLDANAQPSNAEENKNLNQAEEIIAEQNQAGLETNKPNPILERPYFRQPPDLDKISYGFSLLSDIYMENLLIFTKDKFLEGQTVMIEFLIPQNFLMSARVSYCHHFARTSRIISTVKPDYRLQCRFSFELGHERENLRNFLRSIQPAILAPKKNAEEIS
jgi:hypothetical protein